MGRKGVMKLIGKIKNMCKRDRGIWRSYNEACKNDKAFLTELGKFLESYEKCMTQLKGMEEKGRGSDISYMRNILEELKQHSAADQRLLEKVTHLINERKVLYDELTNQKEKPGKKFGCARAWRRCLRMVTYVVFIGAVAAEFACTVMAAVLAAPLIALAIAAVIIPTLAGQHWTLSWIKESPFENQDNVIRFMQPEIMHHFKELQDTERGIRVVSKNINSLLDLLNSVIEGEDDFTMEEIESPLKNLNDLKERARNCKSMILKARDEVSKKLRR
ncbi:UPF0496 protein 1-like [Rosa rugosa]|uniref:UPF0496 protein 1-like n=1 Tax=Rosa rugosa TaxID=74645 RepID=UPI002B40BAAF|nr:UPF0496 protein 1-like [Rosa rugosa]